MFNNFPGTEQFNHIPKSPTSTEKQTEDQPVANKAAASNTSVSLIYQAKVAELCRYVTVTWMKNLINYSLCISVENPSDVQSHYTCKIDLKTWQFWGKKGLKSIEVEDAKRVDVYWDFRQAKFSNNPEPSSDYYVALVYDDEVVLVLGDLKKDAYKRTKKRPSLEEPMLLCKKENVHGRKLFCTKAMLPNSKKEYVIVIEISLCGASDPEMWISIDGFEVIHVTNLHWRFRGNESVTINDSPLQIFWDVHDWLFSSSSSSSSSGNTGNALFILKPGTLGCLLDCVADDTRCYSNGGDKFDLLPEQPLEFFHVIYAWKFDQ